MLISFPGKAFNQENVCCFIIFVALNMISFDPGRQVIKHNSLNQCSIGQADERAKYFECFEFFATNFQSSAAYPPTVCHFNYKLIHEFEVLKMLNVHAE